MGLLIESKSVLGAMNTWVSYLDRLIDGMRSLVKL